MAESKRSQETMKLTMKMGGGGIGAVVLLGGALATAALASAFVVGRNGRSSGHKRTPEINKKQSPSSGEIKEVESDKDNVFVVSNQESTTLDANLMVEEINGETPDNLCSISPKKLETDAISDEPIVIEEKTPSLDGKSQFELTKDDADDENPKESQVPDEKVEEKTTEIDEAVEVTEKQPIKAILVDGKEVEMKSDNSEERHVIDNGEMIFSESDSEDGLKAVQPVSESHVIEHEKKEISEIVNQPDEPIVEHEQVDGDDKREIVNQPDELIVVEKREDPIEVKDEDIIIPCDVKEEENECLEGEIIEKGVEEEIIIINPENIEVVESVEADINDTSLEFDVVQTENIEVVESIEANIDDTTLEFDVVQAKQGEDEGVEEIEGSSETIAVENDDPVTEKSEDDETVLCDEARLVDREVGGKIQEDKAVKKGECDGLSFEHVRQEKKSESDFGNSGKSFTIVMNDRLTNSTDRRIIIAILSVVSSLSCSWFFGLSSAELCLVVFVTMVMSSVVVE